MSVRAHDKAFEITLILLLRPDPTFWIPPMTKQAMRPASKPYSIALLPLSARKNRCRMPMRGSLVGSVLRKT